MRIIINFAKQNFINMNKNILPIFFLTLLVSLFISSCGDDDNEVKKKPTLVGEWTTESRTFSSNYPDFDKRMNGIFVADGKQFDVKRSFSTIEPVSGLGRVNSYAYLAGTEQTQRDSRGDYSLNEAVLYVNDEKLGETESRISFDVYMKDTILTTYTTMSKKELLPLYELLGGGMPNSIPDDIVGEYKTKEFKKR